MLDSTSAAADVAVAEAMNAAAQPLTAAARLYSRADSYASDARTFRDAGRLGRPVISKDDDARWAASYQVIASELRTVAASVLAGEA